MISSLLVPRPSVFMNDPHSVFMNGPHSLLSITVGQFHINRFHRPKNDWKQAIHRMNWACPGRSLLHITLSPLSLIYVDSIVMAQYL